MSETKKESSAQLVIVLFSICLVTSLLLGLANMLTADAIAVNKQRVSDSIPAATPPSWAFTRPARTAMWWKWPAPASADW